MRRVCERNERGVDGQNRTSSGTDANKIANKAHLCKCLRLFLTILTVMAWCGTSARCHRSPLASSLCAILGGGSSSSGRGNVKPSTVDVVAAGAVIAVKIGFAHKAPSECLLYLE
jgi:hypothetical protein